MKRAARIVLTTVWVFGGVANALAQGSASTGQALPDSNMAKPSGNTGEANNGAGQQGSLRDNAGSHSSTVKGASAAAKITTSPKSPTGNNNDPQVEGDPAQGGAKPH